MRSLIIGGTAFMGPFVARNLIAAGHTVTVFHRGQTEGSLPPAVEHIHTPGLAFDDRHELAGFRDTFERLAPEVVVDMILMTAAAARATMPTFHGIARRIVVASSQDVYAAYGRMLGLETGPADPKPANEESPLRQRLHPYRACTGCWSRWRGRGDGIFRKIEPHPNPSKPLTDSRIGYIIHFS